MEVRVKRIRRHILSLSNREARWLEAYVQNSFVEDESAEDQEMRRKIFEALRNPTHE